MHLLLALCLAAQVQYPPRPAEGRFVVDLAGTIDASEEAEIERIAAETLREKRAPIHVVTLKSLAEMGASGWPVERYAMNLFAEWGIGWPEWNHGMLLVVSVGDRKARIELGAGWGRRKDEEAQRLMDRKIVPEFKRGRMSAGVLEGVKGLRSIALGLGSPPGGGGSPFDQVPGARSCGGGATWVIIVLIAIVLLGSISRRRTTGWGPGGMGMTPGCGSFGSGCLGAALGSLFFGGLGGGFGGGRRMGGGGGWGGGSRGGGFSGGGGATGSW